MTRKTNVYSAVNEFANAQCTVKRIKTKQTHSGVNCCTAHGSLTVLIQNVAVSGTAVTGEWMEPSCNNVKSKSRCHEVGQLVFGAFVKRYRLDQWFKFPFKNDKIGAGQVIQFLLGGQIHNMQVQRRYDCQSSVDERFVRMLVWL